MTSLSGFKCELCNKEFTKKSSGTRHMKHIHNIYSSDGLIISDFNPNKFTCDMCDKHFIEKRNLVNHINSLHLFIKSSKTYSCPICDFQTVYQGNLNRHWNKMHKNKESKHKTYMPSTLKFNCSKCNAKFSHEKNLKFHERKVHNMGCSLFTRSRKCPLCSYVSVNKEREDIYSHFYKEHKIKITKKIINFDSIKDFFVWKNGIEKTTTTTYIKRQTTPTTLVYQCHRCGYHKSRSHNKRLMKLSGSCKINGFCPAAITMKLLENKVHVKFVSTHIGHKNELKHIRLTHDEKKSIAQQLKEKKSYEEILRSVRCSISNSELQRLHLLNRKDIINIKNSFHLHDETVKHKITKAPNIHTVAKTEGINITCSSSYECGMSDGTTDCDLNDSLQENNTNDSLIEDIMNASPPNYVKKEISKSSFQETIFEEIKLKLINEFETLKNKIENVKQVQYVSDQLKKIMATVDTMNIPATDQYM